MMKDIIFVIFIWQYLILKVSFPILKKVCEKFFLKKNFSKQKQFFIVYIFAMITLFLANIYVKYLY